MSTTSNPQVEYRRLGKSGLRVSVPILGLMGIGSSKWSDWVVNEPEALALLKAAWEKGVTTWDTANAYSNGESERIIGKALKKFNIPRHRVTILTKCHFLALDKPEDGFSFFQMMQPPVRDNVNQMGLSRGAIFTQVEASLQRLDTTYIDLLQIHRADLNNVSAEETMKALHDLIQSGKVRYIGASSMPAWQFAHYNHVAEKNGWTTFVSMQNKYSLTYREEEREMNAYCAFAGIGTIPYSPLNGGQLARPPSDKPETARAEMMAKFAAFGKPQPAWENDLVRRVEKVAKDKGWKMAQVALAYANAKTTAPIVGVSTVARLEESIIPGYTLTEEEIKFLEELYQPKAVDIVG